MRVVRMRDLAGHARLRDQVARAVGTADGVVFVVDAQTLARNPASVAE
jgi:signal recognition particle receptor subunit beta